MSFRLYTTSTITDSRALMYKEKMHKNSYKVKKVRVFDVYTIDRDFSAQDKQIIAQMLTNPVFEDFAVDVLPVDFDFDFCIEIGFLPGVTDNIATTTRESIQDRFDIQFDYPHENVYSSKCLFISGDFTNTQVSDIATLFANPLIQRIQILTQDQYHKNKGMDMVIPKVALQETPPVDVVDLNVTDEELQKIGQKGIKNADGSYRGPLALGLDYMKAIQQYFQKEGRNPTDIELESIAQTWSEHCKHTIFADPIDEIADGIYKHYIKRATNEVRKSKGKDDFCVSVFTDNSGGIIFDDTYVVTDKAETHNSPAALDPFGAAITGIVGVNRDTLGFGKGAKPVINRYGYCFGNPHSQQILYRGKNKTNPALSPRTVMDGVIAGVNAGGNESGIPSPQGFCYFDERFSGKPLVFVGTVGIIPRKIYGQDACKKQAQPGDKIVVIGGRVGKDGIHGATFSSEALSEGSPATAVQLGDPITQKKLSDALICEARDKDLYHSITDNGAGGISCSVAEMARECGGCLVDLEKVPLKYPHLSPWEIWISESQERITLSIPPENIDAFKKIMDKHGVEMSVIGEFTDSGRCQVSYDGKSIMDLSMEFLHNGLPRRQQCTKKTPQKIASKEVASPDDLSLVLLDMLSSPNITSFDFISQQYDCEVQAGSVIKPLQGKGKVNGSATVTKPIFDSPKGVALSQGINPRYSDIDAYHMAASAIDTAIRNLVALGADVDRIALMDNFCWCSSDDPVRLGQLKDAAKACYDMAIGFGAPYISGKDSMFNDFKGFDENNNPIHIAIPPTLMASSLSVIEDTSICATLDVKVPGDLVYVVGVTKRELGASEYYALFGELGSDVPRVDVQSAYDLYKTFHIAMQKRLIASSMSVTLGGLGVAFAKKAIAGGYGLDIDLAKVIKKGNFRNDELLFSETQSRFVVTIDPDNKNEFEKLFGKRASYVGIVRSDTEFVIDGLDGNFAIETDVDTLEKSYKKTFKDF